MGKTFLQVKFLILCPSPLSLMSGITLLRDLLWRFLSLSNTKSLWGLMWNSFSASLGWIQSTMTSFQLQILCSRTLLWQWISKKKGQSWYLSLMSQRLWLWKMTLQFSILQDPTSLIDLWVKSKLVSPLSGFAHSHWTFSATRRLKILL